MTAEKKNDVYMKVIVGLCGLLITMVSYVWVRAESRMDAFELDRQEAKTERALLLNEDTHIIEKINEFKKSVEKEFEELKEEIKK